MSFLVWKWRRDEGSSLRLIIVIADSNTVVYSCLRFRLFSTSQDQKATKAMVLNHFHFAVAHVESQTAPQHDGRLSNSLADGKTSLLDQKASDQKVWTFIFLFR